MDNIIKQTCKNLGITQKELASITKFKEQTIRNWSSTGIIPEHVTVFLNILKEYQEQKETITYFKNFINSIQKLPV